MNDPKVINLYAPDSNSDFGVEAVKKIQLLLAQSAGGINRDPGKCMP